MDKTRIFAKTKADVLAAYKLISPSKVIGFDTEGSGLDPHTLKRWSSQFSNGEISVLIPHNMGIELGPFADLLEDEEHLIVGHNLKYDLKVLWKAGFDAANLWDSLVMEQILGAGTFRPNNLAAVLKRRLDVTISKEERKDFYDGTFERDNSENPLLAWTADRIEYALRDVIYLPELYGSQRAEIRSQDMQRIERLETDTVPITASLEYRGVTLDAEGCKEFQIEMARRAEEFKGELLEELETYWQQYWRPIYQKQAALYDAWDREWQKVQKQNNERVQNTNAEGRKTYSLSDESKAEREKWQEKKPFNARPKEKGPINIRSGKQLLPALREAGVSLPNLKKETLEDAKGEHPVLDRLLEYRKYEKLGQFAELYEKINPATGRVHTSYTQNVRTGRYSSKEPNLQNIPARTDEGKRFRELFIAPKGRTFVVADFSAIELAIIGILAKDKVLLGAINADLDLHSFTMSKFLNCDYDAVFAAKDSKDGTLDPKYVRSLNKARERFDNEFNLPLLRILDRDVKGLVKWIKTLRDYTKTLTYGIAYGLSSYGLSRKFHCDVETAERFIELFFAIYPRVKDYIERSGKIGFERGYSVTLLGRRSYYRKPHRATPAEIEEEVLKQLDKDSRLLDSVSDDEWYDMVRDQKKRMDRDYQFKVARIKRQAANMTIQGASADITKLSMVLCETRMTKARFPFEDGLVLTVHDELVGETITKRGRELYEIIQTSMVDAAHEILGNDVLIKVEPKISTHWFK